MVVEGIDCGRNTVEVISIYTKGRVERKREGTGARDEPIPVTD